VQSRIEAEIGPILAQKCHLGSEFSRKRRFSLSPDLLADGRDAEGSVRCAAPGDHQKTRSRIGLMVTRYDADRQSLRRRGLARPNSRPGTVGSNASAAGRAWSMARSRRGRPVGRKRDVYPTFHERANPVSRSVERSEIRGTRSTGVVAVRSDC
jgi:hypothetical protein